MIFKPDLESAVYLAKRKRIKRAQMRYNIYSALAAIITYGLYKLVLGG